MEIIKMFLPRTIKNKRTTTAIPPKQNKKPKTNTWSNANIESDSPQIPENTTNSLSLSQKIDRTLGEQSIPKDIDPSEGNIIDESNISTNQKLQLSDPTVVSSGIHKDLSNQTILPHKTIDDKPEESEENTAEEDAVKEFSYQQRSPLSGEPICVIWYY